MKKILWIIFIILVILGIYLEIADINDWHYDYDFSLLSNSWLFFIYIIPILILIAILAKYFKYQWRWLILSLIAGGFIAAQLASFGNEFIEDMINSNIKDWSDALSAP